MHEGCTTYQVSNLVLVGWWSTAHDCRSCDEYLFKDFGEPTERAVDDKIDYQP